MQRGQRGDSGSRAISQSAKRKVITNIMNVNSGRELKWTSRGKLPQAILVSAVALNDGHKASLKTTLAVCARRKRKAWKGAKQSAKRCELIKAMFLTALCDFLHGCMFECCLGLPHARRT